MKAREKRIAKIVLGVAGAYALGYVVYATFVARWVELLSSGSKTQIERQQRENEKAKLPRLAREWSEMGGRTYSAEKGRMNDEMNRQLLALMEKRAGLRQIGGAVMASAQVPVGTGLTATASAKLQGRGSFDAVLRAIYELGRSQRLGRIEKISITRGPGGFDMTADYTARWLDQPTVLGQKITFTAGGKPASQPDALDKSKYASLLGRTMFTQYVRPVEVTYVPPVRPPVTTRIDPPPPPPPPPPPAPTWRNLSVTGVYQSDDARQPLYATVADATTGKTVSLRPGDALADGTVKSIDAEGGLLLMEAGGRVYVVEARRGVTVGDRVLRENYRPVARLPLPDEVKP